MTDEIDDIEYSHIVARTTQPATLNKCEWCWGMDYYTLNLDTRKSIQSLRANLHSFFNQPKAGWLWVPMDLDIMSQFVASYKVNTRKKPTEASLSLTTQQFYEEFFGIAPLEYRGVSHSQKEESHGQKGLVSVGGN
ncbi:hypothetical protein AB1N83_012976 [Pleurotus pulmonarius]